MGGTAAAAEAAGAGAASGLVGVELRELIGRAGHGHTRVDEAERYDRARGAGGAADGRGGGSDRGGGSVVGGRIGRHNRRTTAYFPVHELASYVAEWASDEAARALHDGGGGMQGGEVGVSSAAARHSAVVDGGPIGGGGPGEPSGSPCGGD